MQTHKRLLPIAVVTAVLCSAPAFGAVIQTIGAGSAVNTVDGAADFENTAALFDNPYLEGGMRFSRTALTFDNNGCGYAGCVGHPGFAGFVGNYMYGVGGGGFFDIYADSGQRFFGLEMTPGTGFSQGTVRVVWQAYDGLSLVGSGDVNVPVTVVLGFKDPGGFTRLRLTSATGNDLADFVSTYNAPAFDSVRADFSGHDVPEPASIALLGLGLAAAGRLARRRTRS